jgi:hypothetical protein
MESTESGTVTTSGPNGERITDDKFTTVSALSKTTVEAGKLPPTETTVYMDILSKAESHRYVGTFTFKRLNLNDIAAVGADRARRNGGMVDDHTDFLNTMLAHLDRAIVKCDVEWGKRLGDLYDLNVVSAIYKEVMEYEARFRPTLR